jgi:hypothetical protein
LNKSIRWVGITNKHGIQLAEKYREALQPLLTRQENEEYASHTIARHKKRIKFESKIGQLDYALVKYEKVIRAIIPITGNYYLLVSLDSVEPEFDRIIIKEIKPFVESQKHKLNSIDEVSKT